MRFIDHEVTVNGVETIFTVPERYDNLEFISAGSQGIVVSATDSVTRTNVAIKKLLDPFRSPQSARMTFREIALLSAVTHPNIISLFSAFSPQQSEDTIEDIYLVMELMPYNLQQDLNTRNIAVNGKSIVKVLDFGLARKFVSSDHANMTSYVVTRYYRAPELLLELSYCEKADVWSVGCIFAELITGRVLFPGKDGKDQWAQIVKQLGTPSDEFINKLDKNSAQFVRNAFPHYPPQDIDHILPDENFKSETENEARGLTASNARDLVSKLLEIDPSKRLSAAEALEHPYVRNYRRDGEVNAPTSNSSGAELEELSLNELKFRIFAKVKILESSLS